MSGGWRARRGPTPTRAPYPRTCSASSWSAPTRGPPSPDGWKLEAGEVVGFADLSPDPGDPDALELGAIYVLPDLQGRGIGTRLLEAALARFPSAREVAAEVERENLTARRFYEARGFTETRRRTDHAFGHEFRIVVITLLLEESG